MSSTNLSPANPAAPDVSQIAQGNVSKIRKLYDRTSTTWVTACGILITALAVGALQAGKFGKPPFSWQLCITIVVTCISPALSRHNLWANLKNWQLFLFWGTWTTFSAGPVFISLVLELFTGHQRPGSRWYDGVWRIYAILGIWMVIAVALEQYVKPFWREHSGILFGRFRNKSVSARGQDLAMRERTAKLETIKLKVSILMRRKNRLQALIESKCGEISQLQTGGDSNVDGEAFTERISSLQLEKAAAKDELEDVEDQLKLSQMQWTEALHVNNHHTFYR